MPLSSRRSLTSTTNEQNFFHWYYKMSCTNHLDVLFLFPRHVVKVTPEWLVWTLRVLPNVIVCILIILIFVYKTSITRCTSKLLFATAIGAVGASSVHVYRWFDQLSCNQVDSVEDYRYVVVAGFSGFVLLFVALSRMDWAILSSVVVVALSTSVLVGERLWEVRLHFDASNSTFTSSDISRTMYTVQIYLCVVALCCLSQTRKKLLQITSRRHPRNVEDVDFSQFEPTHRHPTERRRHHAPPLRNAYVR